MNKYIVYFRGTQNIAFEGSAKSAKEAKRIAMENHSLFSDSYLVAHKLVDVVVQPNYMHILGIA